MVKVLLSGHCVGVASSRRIAQRLHEDVAFRVLAANNTPDFRTISDFRKDHLAALTGLFLQVLAFCQRAGLVKLGHVALDGTKVRANVSKHKAMSYKRMKEKEAQLAAELPEELAEVEGKTHPGVPDDEAQRNFTAAESRIMPAPGGRDFQQAYTCQAVVDCAHQVIVAARATSQSSDKQQAVVMIAETISNTGSVPRRSTKGSIRRRRLLLGEGGWRPPCPGCGPIHRARADAPRQSGSARAPRTHTPSSLLQGPDAAQVANQAWS